MKRRDFLKAAGASALALTLSKFSFGAETSKKPNVLFIASDDLNCSLGCYGHPLVKTPNIDRLAARGTVFQKAYCQYSLCCPSRSSLLTGLRPDTTRVFGGLKKYRFFRTTLPDAVTLPQMFKNNGYFAARVGKIFHQDVPSHIGKDGLDDPASWDTRVNPRGRDKDDQGKVIQIVCNPPYSRTYAFLAADGTDEEQTDGIGATETIRLLEQHKDRPFFIACGFYRPHKPFIAPKKYFDHFPLDKIEIPKFPPDLPKTVPAGALASTQPWPWFGATEEETKKAVRAYYACIEFVDAQVGRLLDALDRLGLADNTIIVFWGDNGFHLGELGFLMKRSNFENSARVPLVITAPGQKQTGKPSSRTVELLDIYPTLAELCSLAPPPGLHGKSLRPLLDDPDAAWDKPAFTQVWRGGKGDYSGYSVRTERWRYTQWDEERAGEELYDYQADPGELQNLAHDPAHTETLSRLKTLVQKNWAKPFRPLEADKAGGGESAM